MAPLPARCLPALLVAAAVLTGCSAEPGDRTGVADARTSAPDRTEAPAEASPGSPGPSADEPTTAPSPVVGDAPVVPDPPDLSGVTIDCTEVDTPCDRGDDPALDLLWDACADGDGRACDRLYYDSGFDTRYEQFGNTCGDRDVTIPCPRDLAP